MRRMYLLRCQLLRSSNMWVVMGTPLKMPWLYATLTWGLPFLSRDGQNRYITWECLMMLYANMALCCVDHLILDCWCLKFEYVIFLNNRQHHSMATGKRAAQQRHVCQNCVLAHGKPRARAWQPGPGVVTSKGKSDFSKETKHLLAHISKQAQS